MHHDHTGKYDVIIIGSGIGGLILGALLSKEKRILLLEKNDHFGGYCLSFTRGDFTFEAAVEAINGLKKGQTIYEIFEKAGTLKDLSFTAPKHLYRAIYPEHDFRVPQANLPAYKNLLNSLFPNEKTGIDKLFQEMEYIYAEINTLDRKKTLVKCPHILAYYKSTTDEMMNKYVKDKKLKAILSQYWLYCGLPPSQSSSITFSYICYDYIRNGGYYPKKGMEQLVNACINVIKKNGGNAIKDSEVSKINNIGDKIGEVVLTNKKRFKADFFVSNIDVLKTFSMLSSRNEATDTFTKKARNNETSISAFKVYLGLNVDLNKLGMKDYEVFINPSYDVDKMYNASLQNDAEEAAISLTVYSNLEPNLCPKEKSVLSIAMLSGYDFWESLSKKEYEKTKEKIANALIKRSQRLIPNLPNYIEEKIVGTPLTMERYTGNSRGAIYGWKKGNLYDEIRFMKVATPIKNLFLSSHWTKIGGGIAGVIRTAERACDLLQNKSQENSKTLKSTRI